MSTELRLPLRVVHALLDGRYGAAWEHVALWGWQVRCDVLCGEVGGRRARAALRCASATWCDQSAAWSVLRCRADHGDALLSWGSFAFAS